MDDNKNKSKFYFSNKEIALLAAFFVLLLADNFIWALGPMVGNVVYGVVEGIILIVASIVIGKKYTMITLGFVRTLAEFIIAGAFVGSLTAFSYIICAVFLEVILMTYNPYGESLKINVIGSAVYGIISRIVFLGVSMTFYGMVLPNSLLAFMVIVPTISFAIGGFIGTSFGKRVKKVLFSV